MDTQEQVAPGTIVLIGPMGVGKTSIGRSLAAMLSTDFYDIDIEIESEFGVTGSSIAGSRGVEYLHRVELDIFENLARSAGGGVIACAESVVDGPTGRRILGLTQSVWLYATPEDLAVRRLTSDHRRTVSAQEASALRATRDPHLAECTQLRVDTSSMSVHECAEHIRHWLIEQGI
ncbi:MAG: shikimate kinase [Acidimicrobiia bacterium]